MEIDNVERDYDRSPNAGHPNHNCSQNHLQLSRQSYGESENQGEINNSIFFMKQPRNAYQK